MTFELKILGTSSATPSFNRHPSAQVLNINNQFFLIDCGEGTQMQMNICNVKPSRINHIFISHLHGDHFYGLIGMLTSFSLQGRTQTLYIYAPSELRDLLTHLLKISGSVLVYPLRFISIDNPDLSVLYENDIIQIKKIELLHSIQCYGFIFAEKSRKRKIDTQKIDLNQVSFQSIKDLKNGMDARDKNGKEIINKEVTVDPPLPRSYAYFTDTLYNPTLCENIQNVDLLYHEATFIEKDNERAKETGHSTARQAAMMAKQANVKKLILGHFSSRYKDLQPFLDEAKEIFPETELGVEGNTYIVAAEMGLKPVTATNPYPQPLEQ